MIGLGLGICQGPRMAKKKAKKYDAAAEVRKLARERVGTLPSPKVIVPKIERRKPKHKRPPELEAD